MFSCSLSLENPIKIPNAIGKTPLKLRPLTNDVTVA